jgi:spore germination cell wall hydrolase CwlJ-like protein
MTFVPPYVPPLSREVAALWGNAPPVNEPPAPVAAQERAAPIASAVSRWPRWLHALSQRERVLIAVLIAFTLFLPSAMPRATAEFSGLRSSDSGLGMVERAEENFPGSAFYFLDPNYAIPQNYAAIGNAALIDGTAGLSSADSATAPPPANGSPYPATYLRPVAFRASAGDNLRALQCMTLAIYYEAGLEPDAGQRAVAQVILNRVRHPTYPNTVCGVVFQGSERRTGCQFSFTCDGSMRRKPSAIHWERARRVAVDALAGRANAMVGTATHYHATYVYPYWAPSLKFLGTIGLHRFYSWKGSAGQASAFRSPYRGNEPAARPHPPSFVSTEASTSLDPVQLEKIYEAEYSKAKTRAEAEARTLAESYEKSQALAADEARRLGRSNADAATSIAGQRPAYRTPDYSEAARAQGGDAAFAGQKLPDLSQIKPEYRDSGTWKKKPGS